MFILSECVTHSVCVGWHLYREDEEIGANGADRLDEMEEGFARGDEEARPSSSSKTSFGGVAATPNPMKCGAKKRLAESPKLEPRGKGLANSRLPFSDIRITVPNISFLPILLLRRRSVIIDLYSITLT